MKIKTLGSISAGKDIIFPIPVPENNYSEMNKLPVLSLHVGTWRDRRTACVDTPAEGISEATGHNWSEWGPKNVISKNHYFGEHSLLGYTSLPCSGRMSENLVTQNSFSSESALSDNVNSPK